MTHHIAMLSGKVQQPGHEALRREFLALPDGEYVVRIAQQSDPTVVISEIVDWHGSLSEQEKADPNMLHLFAAKAGQLADALYALAVIAAEASKVAANAKNEEKARQVILEHEAHGSGRKLSAAAVSVEVAYQTREERERAAQCAAVAKFLWAHYDAASKVFSVMSINEIPLLRSQLSGR